jgi:hypothetical protein
VSARNLDSPEQLWDLFLKYKEQLPQIDVPVAHVKLGVVMLPIPSPMTMEGFKCYLWDKGVGEIKRYIDNTEGNFNNYVPIITRIKQEIFNHNFSRAACNMYKENLIARQLGLAEKNQTNISVEQPLFPDVPKNDSDNKDSQP